MQNAAFHIMFNKGAYVQNFDFPPLIY